MRQDTLDHPESCNESVSLLIDSPYHLSYLTCLMCFMFLCFVSVNPIRNLLYNGMTCRSKYDTTHEEALVQTLDLKMKRLRHHEILLVKVLWQHHGVEEVT